MNDLLNKFVEKDAAIKNRIAELKKESGYYPKVLIKPYREIGFVTELYASTLVRIERDGIWYIVHCVEWIVPNSQTVVSNLLLRLMDSVYKIQCLYKIPNNVVNFNGVPIHDIDLLQISEIERLSTLNF